MTWKTAIEARMAKSSMTKAELARRTGLSKGYISELLNKNESKRKTQLSMDTARKIAYALGTHGWILWKESSEIKEAERSLNH